MGIVSGTVSSVRALLSNPGAIAAENQPTPQGFFSRSP
jgi:hypothetical protein